MNHAKEGVPHESKSRCRYSHQYDNRVYTCKVSRDTQGQDLKNEEGKDGPMNEGYHRHVPVLLLFFQMGEVL